MFYVKLVNKLEASDIVFNKEYENEINAQKYYERVKAAACADSQAIVRKGNEELEQPELKYCDVILYLLEDDKVISKYMRS